MNTHSHVLVVDDDDILRAGICDLLDLEGYHVTAAHDGKHALQLLEQMPHPPAIIVSDIRMPRLDGYSFLEAVRARPEWLSIPFIFLSAKGDKKDVRVGRLRGADDYITKPFDFQDLLVAIQSSLNRAQELSSLQEQRLDTLKQRILHIINHEFRTPLTYIVAYADLMAKNESFQHHAELSEYVNGIIEGSERLSRLVEKFLMLAELESGLGKKIYERRRQPIYNLTQHIAASIDAVRESAERQNVSLALEVSNHVPPIMADMEYLHMAIRELLDNAIKFTPPEHGGVVTVTVETGDQFVTVGVSDEGMGISEEEQEHLFDMFYQVDRERREIAGTGSGLPIVRHVAEVHGGQIRLDSNKNSGSHFRLRLPIGIGEKGEAGG